MHSAALLLEMAPSKRIGMVTRRVARKPTPEQMMRAVARSVLSNSLERKVFSITATGVAVLTAGTVVNVTNGVIEGDDIGQRQGTVIKLSRFRILYRATASATSSSIRFILFRDMFNQGTTPAVADILPSGQWISQYADTRVMQQHRFKILNDVMLDLEIAGSNVKTRQYDVPVKGNVAYNGATAVSASNGAGAVFLLVIGNAITTQYDYTIQLLFTDA